jgi:hypothetical protein
MTDEVGLFEHARFEEPNREHGYCTDDNARALAVTVRAGESSEVYLRFVEDAQLPDGRFHNRRALDGSWADEVGSDDSQGRAIFGLGIAGSVAAFDRGAAAFASVWPRANAYAAIGAAELLARHPGHPPALALLERTVPRLGAPSADPLWPWSESRLAYDNARLPEARIAAGVALWRPALVEEGVDELRWLARTERRDGHFSFTPVGGWAPPEPRPGFDQQPIEAGAMGEACARAYDATGEESFAGLAGLAARWFLGENDTGVTLVEPESGGCCDGLQRSGRNENQGAESTLAALAAFQAAARSARSSSGAETVAAPTFRSAAPYVM